MYVPNRHPPSLTSARSLQRRALHELVKRFISETPHESCLQEVDARHLQQQEADDIYVPTRVKRTYLGCSFSLCAATIVQYRVFDPPTCSMIFDVDHSEIFPP